MRDIKFRAWDIDHKMMYQNEINYAFWRVVATWQHAPDVMQYTGLLDKNGVEIYEGDLLKHHSSELLSEVIFNDGTFWMKNIMWDNPLGRMNDQLEVIGNIYENPELLTPTKENLTQEKEN